MIFISLKDDIKIEGSAFVKRKLLEHPEESFIYRPDFHLLQYFDAADRKVTLEGIDYSIQKGSVLHSCANRPYTSHRPLADTKAINIIFRVDSPQKISGKHSISLPFIVDMQNHPTIRIMFEELVYLSMKYGVLEVVKAELLLKRILVEITEFNDRNKYTCSVGFQHSIACIEKNLQKNYTIEELAAIAGMSRSTYIRSFNRIIGMSVKSYILQTKLRIAITVLTTEAGATVKEVAYQLGFCDEFHFSKIFKKHTGKSPSDYQIIG